MIIGIIEIIIFLFVNINIAITSASVPSTSELLKALCSLFVKMYTITLIKPSINIPIPNINITVFNIVSGSIISNIAMTAISIELTIVLFSYLFMYSSNILFPPYFTFYNTQLTIYFFAYIKHSIYKWIVHNIHLVYKFHKFWIKSFFKFIYSILWIIFTFKA